MSMFGDIPLCGDDELLEEGMDEMDANKKKGKKKKKRKADVDFAALSSAGWEQTASLKDSEFGQKLEHDRVSRLVAEREAAEQAAAATHVPEPEGAALTSVSAPVADEEGGGAKKPRKEETTRKKNARKEKLGQAKFTVKSERECPDVWQGAG